MTDIPVTNLSDNIFTHIIHVSDIHIKPRDRFDEYEQVFNKLYAEINKLKSKKIKAIIVITGDILDNKHVFSPSTYKLCGDLFTNLANLYPTIVILGNHDFASLTMLDSVSPVAYPRDNFYFLTKSGIYNYGNVSFVLNSLYDNTYEFIKREHVKTDKLCALLYHGTIENSSTDDGIVFKNEGTTRFRKKSDLDGYDIVLLGDIHKFQEVKKNAYYSGSLIQQNFGETVNNHGFLVWNIKDKNNIQVEFKEIINEYGRITVKIENNVWINPDIIIPKKSYIRCITSNTIEEKKNDILEQIRANKKTEILDVIVISNDKIIPSTTITKTEDEITTKEDIVLQELRKTDREDTVKEELVQLHKKYYQAIDKYQEEKNNNKNYLWYPVKLEFKNMFGYAKNVMNKIDFKAGVTSITAPNATGKTSIINILFYTLFNDLLLNPGRSKHADIINNKESEAYVKLDVQYGTTLYTIEKTVKRRTGVNPIDVHQKISYMENNKPITKEQKLASDMIKDMFGSITDYYKCNILNNRDQTNDFFRLTDIEKIKYLKQSFNLNCFDNLTAENKKDIFDSKEIVNSLRAKRSVYNDEYIKIANNDTAYEDNTKIQIKKLTNNQKVLEKEIKILSIEYDDLHKQKTLKESEIVKTDNSIDFYQKENNIIRKKYKDLSIIYDLNALNNEIVIKKSQLISLKQTVEQLNTKFKEINKELITLKDYNTKESKETVYKNMVKYETEKVQQSKELNKLNKEIAKYNEDNIQETNKTKDMIENEINTLNKEYKKVPQFTQEQINQKITQIKKKLNSYKNTKPTNNTELLISKKTTIKHQIEHITQDIDKYTILLSKLNKTTEECDLSDYENNITTLKNKLKQPYPVQPKKKIDMKKHNKNVKDYEELEKEINELLTNTFTNENIDEFIKQIDGLLEKDKILAKEYSTIKTNLLTPLKTMLNDVKNNTIEEHREKLNELTEKKNNLWNEVNNINNIIKENDKIDAIIKENHKIQTENDLINKEINNYEYHYYDQKVKELEAQKTNLTNELLKLEKIYEYTKLTNELNDYTEQLNIYKMNEEIDNKLAVLVNEKNYIEYNILKSEEETLKKELQKTEVLSNKLKQQYKKIQLIEEKGLIEKDIKQHNINETISNEIEQLHNQIEYEKSRQKYNNNILMIENIKRNIVLKEEINTILLKLNEIKEQQEQKQKEKMEIGIKIINYNESLERLAKIKTEVETLTTTLIDNETKLKIKEDYGHLISPKVLQTTIIQRELQKLEKTMNDILNKYTKYEVKINYKSDSGISIQVQSNDDKSLSIERLSTYETIILTTAFKRAIGKHTNQTHSKLYVIDESMEHLDETNFNKVLPELMKLILEEYSYILIISQRDISHISDNCIKIIKENGISKIV